MPGRSGSAVRSIRSSSKHDDAAMDARHVRHHRLAHARPVEPAIADRLVEPMTPMGERDVEPAEGRSVAHDPDEPIEAHGAIDIEETAPRPDQAVGLDRET
jgi:hypothetical protein